MANDKREKTKFEIVKAAIECINEEGLQNATIRKIAEKAGINSAAISYYFGSREELISQAMVVTLDNAFDFNDFEYTPNDDYKDILKMILEHWKQGALAYPGICRAHFDDIMNNHIKNDITLSRINGFIEKVYEILTEHGLNDNDINYKKLRLIFGGFISTLTMREAAYPNNMGDEIETLVDML